MILIPLTQFAVICFEMKTIKNDFVAKRIFNFFDLFSYISKFTGWIACSFLLVALTFSKAFVPLSSHWMEAILSTINHTIWSIILVWIIVASLSKHRGRYYLYVHFLPFFFSPSLFCR